jgi:hypothetical protein
LITQRKVKEFYLPSASYAVPVVIIVLKMRLKRPEGLIVGFLKN